MTVSSESLHAAWLAAEVEQVRLAMQAALDEKAPRAQLDDARLREAREALRRVSPRSPLERLAEAFGLSRFEQAVVVALAGAETDGKFAAWLCDAQAGRSALSFGTALRLLPEAHFSAAQPARPLRHYWLIELDAAQGLLLAPLRLVERVLHFLMGSPEPDPRLFLERVAPGPGVSPVELVATLRGLWSAAQSAPPPVALLGPSETGKRSQAAQAAASVQLGLLAVRAFDVPTQPHDRHVFGRLLSREAALAGAAIYLDADDVDDEVVLRNAAQLVDTLDVPAFVSSREPLPPTRRSVLRFDVKKPARDVQRSLLEQALAAAERQATPEALDALLAQFDLGPDTIHDAVRAAALDSTTDAAPDARLWQACREQTRRRLDDLAQRIEPRAAWDELILPEAHKRVLDDVIVHVRHRARVYDHWGFAEKSERGLGIGALFSGSSGTGKTMAAEVLARRLELDLYRIDLSGVVSKYIGETEKNLRRLFDAADGGGAILLFDEADALFGKRTEVKDSHDRYANIEVSYLLQRIEAYRGLAILTTNMRDALDEAFLRRIRFHVAFPFPGQAERARIWQRAFPAATPTLGLDPERLSRLGVSGGSIRNIALHAAFLAAEERSPVTMDHALRAARSEYGKLERPFTEAELRGVA